MTDDLVQRLRSNRPIPTLPHEAADRIGALEEDIERLRERVKRVENNNRELRGSKERVYAATDLRQPTQSDVLREAIIEECASALEADAKLCDCAALEANECACGAWDDYKSITSARAVEIVRALAT